MAVRVCVVSFQDASGIRHSVDVEAESLYEAVVLAVKRFRTDIWSERISAATKIDVEIREPSTRHSLTLEQVGRWLASANAGPSDAAKKARLKMMLVQG